MTSVVDVRFEECDVYIGRACGKWPKSKWHNPYRIGEHGSRDQVIEMYRAYLIRSPHLLAALPELKNKILGCWCGTLRCHGDVLAEIVNALNLVNAA